MTDNSKKLWAFDHNELFCINYLEARGFDVTIDKRHVSCDYLTVSRDGFTDSFRLPLTKDMNAAKYMATYEKQFEQARELQELRKAFEGLA